MPGAPSSFLFLVACRNALNFDLGTFLQSSAVMTLAPAEQRYDSCSIKTVVSTLCFQEGNVLFTSTCPAAAFK